MFETTATGHRATDEAIAFWQSRDICPGCGAVTASTGKTDDGRFQYICPCDGDPVEWTAFSPADTARITS